MTNTELIQAINAKIERMKEEASIGLCEYDAGHENGICETCNDLLSFLSTLESETTYDTQQYTPRTSVGIEDVARVQFASHAKVFNKKRKAVFDWEQFKEVASIFYGFGKKESSDTIESEKPTQEELEEELNIWRHIHFNGARDGHFYGEYLERTSQLDLARHFAQWCAEHANK